MLFKDIRQDIKNLNAKFNTAISEIQTVKDNLFHVKDELKADILIVLKQYIDSRLLDYKKQMMDEQYSVLNKLIEFNKTLFMSNGKKATIVDELEDYLLKQKWDKEEKDKGTKIINKGQEIIKKRKELYDTMIKEERMNKDVEALKIKIAAYDEIIGGLS